MLHTLVTLNRSTDQLHSCVTYTSCPQQKHRPIILAKYTVYITAVVNYSHQGTVSVSVFIQLYIFIFLKNAVMVQTYIKVNENHSPQNITHINTHINKRNTHLHKRNTHLHKHNTHTHTQTHTHTNECVQNHPYDKRRNRLCTATSHAVTLHNFAKQKTFMNCYKHQLQKNKHFQFPFHPPESF